MHIILVAYTDVVVLGVFVSSGVTRACPVTTDLIMRVDVTTTTTPMYAVLSHVHFLLILSREASGGFS